MSVLALPAGSQRVLARIGVLLRPRSWIAAFAARRAVPVRPAAEAITPEPAEEAKVLQFPGSGYADLSGLARDLKQRFASLDLVDFEPFILELKPGTKPRLLIDRTTYVEYCGTETGYRAVLDDAFQMRMTIETHDFRFVESLIGHYIVARLAEPASGESA